MNVNYVDEGLTGMENLDWIKEHQKHIKENKFVKNCSRCDLFIAKSLEKGRLRFV